MPSRLNPYLNFDGNTKDAMEFYKGVFGGELELNTFGESGGMDGPGADNIMHANLDTDRGFTLMASDPPPGAEHQPGNNISISLSGDDGDELRGYWEKLSDGGTVTVPLEKAPWGDTFGMCNDKFGVSWLVNIAGAQGSRLPPSGGILVAVVSWRGPAARRGGAWQCRCCVG